MQARSHGLIAKAEVKRPQGLSAIGPADEDRADSIVCINDSFGVIDQWIFKVKFANKS